MRHKAYKLQGAGPRFSFPAIFEASSMMNDDLTAYPKYAFAYQFLFLYL